MVRWKPARELAPLPGDVLSMQREINRLFDGLFRGGAWDESLEDSSRVPAVDIAENYSSYIVKAELPGVTKKDVAITLQDNVLTVRGEKRQEKEPKDASFHRSERTYGAFQRSFTLPSTVVAEKIDASFTDGILTVTLPKSEEAKPRQIEVKLK
jgi:HSP20 family protein